VLPTPVASELSGELREESCLDVWTAVFPGEREDWKGRSCIFKVRWGQCNKFYPSCQCSCGYCLPTHDHGCSPDGGIETAQPTKLQLPPPPPAGGGTILSVGWLSGTQPPRLPSLPPLLVSSASTKLSLDSSPPSYFRQLQPPLPPPPSLSGGADPSSALPPTLRWVVLALTEGGAAAPWAVGVVCSVLVLVCLLCRVLLSCCRLASRPDAPLWLQACSHALCKTIFVGHAAASPGSAQCGYISVEPNASGMSLLGLDSASAFSVGFGSSGGRAATAMAALDEEEETEHDDSDSGHDFDAPSKDGGMRASVSMGVLCVDRGAAKGRSGHGDSGRGGELEVDGHASFGAKRRQEAEENPLFEMLDLEDDIGPDDSISVAHFKRQGIEIRCTHDSDASTSQLVGQAAVTPVTIEAPDGSRHGMDVELEGLGSTSELRRGMLQGYRDLLGIRLPTHLLRVHARLRTGSSVLLTDETPLSAIVLDVVSFYVWAVADVDRPPSVSELKGMLHSQAR